MRNFCFLFGAGTESPSGISGGGNFVKAVLVITGNDKPDKEQ